MDEVFLDASFWVALVFPADQDHERARALWEPILGTDRRTVTTDWTLYEALTVLNGRRTRRHDLALQLLNLARRSTHIVAASESEARTLEVFTNHSDKRWSVVDCANFVCINERRSRWALAFDRDFAQAQSEFGFTLLGAGAAT